MSEVEEFKRKQQERVTEVQAYKLASILNEEEAYHPKHEWIVVTRPVQGLCEICLREKSYGIFEAEVYDLDKVPHRTLQLMLHPAMRLDQQSDRVVYRFEEVLKSAGIVSDDENKLHCVLGEPKHGYVLKLRCGSTYDLSDAIKKAEANYSNALKLEKDFSPYVNHTNYGKKSEEALKEYALLTAKKAVTR